MVLTANFLLPRLIPGDPIDALLDPENPDFVSDEEVRAELEAYYGLDDPMLVQYGRYLSGLVQGDFGQSIKFRRPVSEMLISHLPWTLLLMIPSLLLATATSLALGTIAAWRRGKPLDKALTAIVVAIWTMPVFFTGLLLKLGFAVHWQIFPLDGATTRFATFSSWFDQARDIGFHLVLPATTMTLSLIGGQFLLMRNSVVGSLGSEHITVARAKGLSERRIRWQHGARPAMLPSLTLFATQIGFALTGTLLIEELFAYPGMGRLLFDAVETRDYPVIQGAFVVVSLAMLIANMMADLLYVRIDPRVSQ